MKLVKYFCDVCHTEVEQNQNVESNVMIEGTQIRLNCVVCAECLRTYTVWCIIKELVDDDVILSSLRSFSVGLKSAATRLEPKQMDGKQ